jgi:hypothetical protein
MVNDLAPPVIMDARNKCGHDNMGGDPKFWKERVT